MLAGHLKRLAAKHAGLEIHLVGHSAGSILHGHLLDLLRRAKLQVASCTLFAPACTLRFALQYYGKAITAGTLTPGALFVENLSEEREQADSVGPYGKSLLYLVSRALEDFHKMPLLGKTLEWTETDNDKRARLFGPAGAADVEAWQAFVKQQQLNAPTLCRTPTVSDGLGRIPAAHGSFDNDVAVITRTIQRAKAPRQAGGRVPARVLVAGGQILECGDLSPLCPVALSKVCRKGWMNAPHREAIAKAVTSPRTPK